MKGPNRNLGQYALLFALLARIAVPAGFMPADTSQGWFLELCPEGLALPAMVALLGDSTEHLHHHGGPEGPDTPAEASYDNNCLLNGLALSAVATSAIDLPVLATAGDPFPLPAAASLEPSPTTPYRSRAPPLA